MQLLGEQNTGEYKMQKIIYTILVLLVVFNSGYSQTTAKQNKLNLSTGLSIPNGPDEFGDYWNAGLNFGASFSIELSRALSVDPAISYQSFPFNGDKFIQDFGAGGLGITTDGEYISLNLISGFQIQSDAG